ncbi:MAG: hypothetical protein Q7T20_09380 [Saprospiraceae bacterium]|nr:hypothetical protein [Saprospiraceae bacterium]
MSNITRLAPYAYLAKRSGSNTLYDLLLLVPVDASGDTNLSNVSADKPGGTTRITIDYATNGSNAGTLYRFKHFEIDSDGTYLDIEIQGNNSADLTTVLAFADADTEQAVVSSQMQTCAPYIFTKIETVGSLNYLLPSCIVIFDSGLGAQSEAIISATNKCTLNFTLGNSGATTAPTSFLINQDIKAFLTTNQEFTFEVNIAANDSFSKPPRKGKVKIYVSS